MENRFGIARPSHVHTPGSRRALPPGSTENTHPAPFLLMVMDLTYVGESERCPRRSGANGDPVAVRILEAASIFHPLSRDPASDDNIRNLWTGVACNGLQSSPLYSLDLVFDTALSVWLE